MPSFDLNNLPESEDQLDFNDIEEEYKVSIEESFDTTVVVDNVPVVDESKQDKLKNALRKIFKSQGLEFKDIHMPQTETNGKKSTKGFVFIEFETSDDAMRAVKDLNNYPMDKTHILKVNMITDIEKFTNVGDEFVEPKPEPYEEKEHLKSWLTDRGARDQFVMYGGDDVTIYWNMKTEAPAPVYTRPHWTATYVSWSPLGSYLTTIHKQGVALWGGPSWKKITQFAHPHVELMDFSPCEKYLVTWSNKPISLSEQGPNTPFGVEDEGHEIVIWDIRSGRLLRSFPYLSAPQAEGSKRKIFWPVFKWSPSDRYFARVTPGTQISIYEAPSMGLLDKKSLKVDGVVDFEWQPASQNDDKKSGKAQKEHIAFWTPEYNNQPARVTVTSIPDRALVRTKNLFNVTECKLHWQSNGDYLCVKVDRHTKTKKSSFTSLEIFRVREKEIPVEVVELKDTAIAFAWEPNGDRFVVITNVDSTAAPAATAMGTGPQNSRTTVFFYQLEKAKAGSVANVKLLKTLEKKTCNRIHWSPKGRHLVLATIGSSTVYDIEFWDLDFEVSGGDNEDRIMLMAVNEHYGLTDIEWDPTGRYLITSSSIWRHSIENGFTLWDFKGQKLYHQLIDKFRQLLWRPRPKSLLSKEEMKKIRKNLKDYSREFDQEDARAVNAVSAQVLAHRKRLLEEWMAWRKRAEEAMEAERKERGLSEVRREKESAEEVIEEWIEEVIEEYEEEVN